MTTGAIRSFKTSHLCEALFLLLPCYEVHIDSDLFLVVMASLYYQQFHESSLCHFVHSFFAFPFLMRENCVEQKLLIPTIISKAEMQLLLLSWQLPELFIVLLTT